jgi:integrase
MILKNVRDTGLLGVDIRTIQDLMRHKDIKTTMRYSHPTREDRRKAVGVLEARHGNFHNTTNNWKAAKVVSI